MTCYSNVWGSSTISLSHGPAESSLFTGLITSASCGKATATSSVSELLLSYPCASNTKTEKLSWVLASSKDYISQVYFQCVQNYSKSVKILFVDGKMSVINKDWIGWLTNCKESAVVWQWYYPAICLVGLKKIKKKICCGFTRNLK